MELTIRLDDDEVKILKKRGKKNLLELREMVEDIVRRSCIRAKSNVSGTLDSCDDKLVSVFSRSR